MRPRWPKAAELLEGAEEGILAFMNFPIDHWSWIYSTNPLERLIKEIKRRTNVVGIFPDQATVIRLVGSILIEISDEWQIGRRYFNRESMKKVMEMEPLLVADQAPFCLAPVH